MAADGVWAGDSEPPGARTAHALDELRLILDQLETRFRQPEASPLAVDASAVLIQSIDRLAARLAERETADAARAAELSRALAALAARLDADAHRRPVLEVRRDRSWVTAALSLGVLSGLASVTLAILSPREPRPSGPEPERPAPQSPALAPRPEARLESAAPQSGASPLIRGMTGLPKAQARTADGALGDESYAGVLAALGRGDPLALPRLAGLADLGDTDAQLHLASLYETGGAGLPRDLAAARLWTRRAAEGGERIAMHNLGLFLAQGDGGVRDAREAAVWFRRAAERGVVDSQYNLGLVHESGQGVPANLREAYRWFSVAANAGDLKARRKQIELEPRLAPGERAAVDREASAYRPEADDSGPPAPVVPPAVTVADSQALLARQGYYLGPADGRDSAAYRAALEAYLRDQTKP